MNIYHARKRIRHTITAGYWRGHHVHSPFVYHLVRHIITTRTINKALLRKARLYRASLTKNKQTITVTDYGTGANKSPLRKISAIAKRTAISDKYGLLLARMVEDYKPANIIEMGTSLGMSTFYLASCAQTPVITIEGCPNCSAVAQQTLTAHGISNVQYHVGNFDNVMEPLLDALPEIGLIYIDGNHTEDATLRYFELVARRATPTTIAIFDDIHLNPGMTKAWKRISNDSRVMTSIDIFQLGIIFFRTGCQKEHYTVRW